MFLTPEDIAALTLGSSAAVNFMDIAHKIRPNGSIVVLRVHVEKVPEPDRDAI